MNNKLNIKELQNNLQSFLPKRQVTPEQAMEIMGEDIIELCEKFNGLTGFFEEADEQFIKLAKIVNQLVSSVTLTNGCIQDLNKRVKNYEDRIEKLEEKIAEIVS